MSLTVSVLGTVLGPIHTTLLGLFHPRIPQTLWNSGRIDRRKLEACLEFTTISTDRGAASHQQELNFLPRLNRFPHGQVFLWLVSSVSPSNRRTLPLCRLIEIQRHGLGNFSDSNKMYGQFVERKGVFRNGLPSPNWNGRRQVRDYQIHARHPPPITLVPPPQNCSKEAKRWENCCTLGLGGAENWGKVTGERLI